MLDILTIVHSFADIRTASRIRRTCHRLAALTPEPTRRVAMYTNTAYEYKVGSKLHRLDGPAWEHTCRDKYWYRGGIAHREYHPQYTYESYREYKVDGLLHREAGPSITSGYYVSWWWRGKRHRKIGPGITSPLKIWYTLDKLHRLDGPAYVDLYAIRGIEHCISRTTSGVWVVHGMSIRDKSG